jgi:hypothetical protein
MTKFKFVVRREAWVSALDKGCVDGPLLEESLRFTEPPLLASVASMKALRSFLLTVTERANRRNLAQQAEGERLATLIERHGADVLHPRWRSYLLDHLRGLIRKRPGRPTVKRNSVLQAMTVNRDAMLYVSFVTKCLKEGRPVEFEGRPLVNEEPEWKSLPVADRAWAIVREMLYQDGRAPLSVRTLRNRCSLQMSKWRADSLA